MGGGAKCLQRKAGWVGASEWGHSIDGLKGSKWILPRAWIPCESRRGEAKHSVSQAGFDCTCKP